MNFTKNTLALAKSNLFVAFSIIAILFLLTSFKGKDTIDTTSKKYLTMVVQYNDNASSPNQKLSISSSETETKELYLVSDELEEWKKEEYLAKGKTFKEGKMLNLFDNSMLLSEIEAFTKSGWILKEHNFAIGKSASASASALGGDVNQRSTNETERISYFNFEQ